jgi:hypothetical protein
MSQPALFASGPGTATGSNGISPFRAPAQESVIRYLNSGNPAPGLDTWNRLYQTFQVPALPTGPNRVPVRYVSGFVGDGGARVLGIVLNWGVNTEFGITDNSLWYLTAAYEVSNIIPPPGNQPHTYTATALTPVVYVYPGDWVTASISLIRQDNVAYYGTENLWDMRFQVNNQPSQSIQLYFEPNAFFDASALGSIATDSTLSSCSQLPQSAQQTWYSQVFYWDENRDPNNPAAYTEDTAGPFVHYGSWTYQTPFDCPNPWPKWQFSPPSFTLGWTNVPLAPPPALVPATRPTALIALLVLLGGLAAHRLRTAKRRR